MMFWDYFHNAEACHQEKKDEHCEYCQKMYSQWHFKSRNAQILHVLQFLEYYLTAHKEGEMEEPKSHCIKSPALNSSFCSPLQKSKRQMDKTACRHTNSILVLTTATCCHSAWCIFNHLTCVTQCRFCSPAPLVTALVPGAFKVMGFGGFFVTTHGNRSTRNVSDFSDHFWGFLFSSLLWPMP